MNEVTERPASGLMQRIGGARAEAPIVTPEQVKYLGLIFEMQSVRTLRTDHSMRCVWIWLGLAGLYFGASLVGSTDPRVVAFHRAIPWISVVLGILFILTDKFNFRQFSRVVTAGDRLGNKWDENAGGKETEDAFSLQNIDKGPLGFSIIQWKLLGGIMAWVYIMGNQYFDFHAHLVKWFLEMKALWL